MGLAHVRPQLVRVAHMEIEPMTHVLEKQIVLLYNNNNNNTTMISASATHL